MVMKLALPLMTKTKTAQDIVEHFATMFKKVLQALNKFYFFIRPILRQSDGEFVDSQDILTKQIIHKNQDKGNCVTQKEIKLSTSWLPLCTCCTTTKRCLAQEHNGSMHCQQGGLNSHNCPKDRFNVCLCEAFVCLPEQLPDGSMSTVDQASYM